MLDFPRVILTLGPGADLGLLRHPTLEIFVIIVNGFQLLTIITKCSILDVAAILDPPLGTIILPQTSEKVSEENGHLFPEN